MSKRLHDGLSMRERQIMETVYRKKQANVTDVLISIPNPPTYSAVRATMNILVNKGFLTIRKEGKKYYYLPTIPHKKAQQSALKRLVETYFGDSVTDAVATLIRTDKKGLSNEEYNELIQLIEEARKEKK